MMIGDILRELIEERDMTQKELAERLSIGVSTLSNYFQNNRQPDYETLRRLAEFFDVTTDYLLDHSVDKTHGHNEEELLRIFRALTKDQQELYLKQGKLLMTYFSNNKNTISIIYTKKK